MKNKELLYQIGLTLIPKIGPKLGRTLLAHCGGLEAVFAESKKNLIKIEGIGTAIANQIINKTYFERAEKELLFIEKNNIQTAFYLSDNYPDRLKHFSDAPLLLYYKGNSPLENKKVIAIVGTRNATPYGEFFCADLLKGLSIRKDILIVSGLAYGIDSFAHQESIKNNIPNIGVLAHGLDRIYPPTHRKLANNIMQNGCLLTEFPSGTIPEKNNFPRRNRIIAGLSDAVIVVESKIKGGAIITAEIANSYNRDVFAVPGRLNDKTSEGCNNLIKTNRAALIESVKDLEYILGWEKANNKPAKQKRLFIDLSIEEEQLINLLEEHEKLAIDELIIKTGFRATSLASHLLNLEFAGLIKCLPGKVYMLL